MKCGLANNSLTPGTHWEVFIKNDIASGRYGFASVVRDALRNLEARKSKFSILRTHLGAGVMEAKRGNFVISSLDAMLGEFKAGHNGAQI